VQLAEAARAERLAETSDGEMWMERSGFAGETCDFTFLFKGPLKFGLIICWVFDSYPENARLAG
jgi:hypothetical protein